MKLLLLFALAVAVQAEDALQLSIIDSMTGYQLDVDSNVIVPKSPQGKFAKECAKQNAKTCNWMNVKIDGEQVGRIDSRGQVEILNPDGVMKALWLYAFGIQETKTDLHFDLPLPKPSFKTVAWDGDESAKQPTAEQLQSQLAAKDQQIATLNEQLAMIGQRHDNLMRSLTGCLGPLPQQQTQQPALNPQQRRMMQRPPVEPAKPDGPKSK